MRYVHPGVPGWKRAIPLVEKLSNESRKYLENVKNLLDEA